MDTNRRIIREHPRMKLTSDGGVVAGEKAKTKVSRETKATDVAGEPKATESWPVACF